MRVVDFIDIIIVSVLFYYLYKFVKDRRAGKLAVGVLLLLTVFLISDLLQMHALTFLFSNVFQVGLIALIILFQPELRSMLEKVGGEPLKSIKNIGDQRTSSEVNTMISELSEAVCDMSKVKTGALIVIERSTKLGDIIKTGTVINANVDSMLIKNVFYNKAPLHDGAAIITGTRLYAAGCFLPLSSNDEIVKDLGTRHRAAIGMSESSDAIVIVVSEETGTISVAINGELKRNLDYNTLVNQLRSLLVTQPHKLISTIKSKQNGENQ